MVWIDIYSEEQQAAEFCGIGNDAIFSEGTVEGCVRSLKEQLRVNVEGESQDQYKDKWWKQDWSFLFKIQHVFNWTVTIC